MRKEFPLTPGQVQVLTEAKKRSEEAAYVLLQVCAMAMAGAGLTQANFVGVDNGKMIVEVPDEPPPPE